MQEIKRIICPVDLYDFLPEAADSARALAHAFRAKITVLYVFEPLPSRYAEAAALGLTACTEETRIKADVLMEKIISEHFGIYADSSEIIFGSASDEIVKYAEKHSADIIVMSSHGRSTLGRVIHGSVTNRVLADARVPVLIVKPSKK